MSQPFRLASGGRVDRSRTLTFKFDNRTYTGFHGDTLGSALLANGVHLFGRSFKYHRPRGILAAGPEEPNALVRVSRGPGPATPNLRAPTVELFDGLVAFSQNRSPSLRYDAGAVTDRLAAVLPAGFYYKTFMWPHGAWHRLYEPAIRRAAGLGRAPDGPDPDHYAHRFAHADVLVVGAGPAGLSAASAAAATGARVILCDEQPEPGGGALSEPHATVEGTTAADWTRATMAELAANERVTVLTRTTAIGHFPHNSVLLVERLTDHLERPRQDAPRERMWTVRARQIVFAAGAIERPLVFSNNDRPGIMLAGAARSFSARYGVAVGRRAVVVTAHDAAYDAAVELHEAGVPVALIADLRTLADGPAQARARDAGIRVATGMRVAGTRGRLRVSGIDLVAVGGESETVACDAVLMSGGFTPSVHLHSQARGKLRFDADMGAYLPDGSVERVRSAGAGRGVYALSDILRDGAEAGAAAGAEVPGTPAPAVDPGGGMIGVAPGTPKGGPRFVDFQNDVTEKDLHLAMREGFRSIEHVKRYTTTGMATDQGKTSNMNALGIVAAALDVPVPKVGLTTFRMPYTPTSFGAFAGHARGELFDPVRATATHEIAAAQGTVFEDVGQWKRARYFPHGPETMEQAVARECRAVRASVGMFDASTLGKIEVCGPDAAEFLERMYVNAWKKLGVGRCRYGVMLRESGFVMDDGVVGRLATDRFHVTTTTGNAAPVLAHMEDYLQTEWPELDAWLTSVTEQWAVVAVQGPRARRGGVARRGRRPRRVPAHERRRGADRRVRRPPIPRQLHRRARLRVERAGGPWRGAVERDRRGGAGARHRPVRHRGDARPARRKRLLHRRPGERRHGDARRPRARLGGVQGQARLRRQAVAGPPRHGECGPQADGGPGVGRPRHRAGRGRATGRRRLAAREPGPRHVGLPQRCRWRADRARHAGRRTCAGRRSAAGPRPGRRRACARHDAGVRRSRGGAAGCLTSRSSSR